MIKRKATIHRKTKETEIDLTIVLDGEGKSDINTGIGFLNHMLDLFAKHALFDIKIKVIGDLDVDGHHSVEDIGICLGKGLKEALGDKKGIKRFSSTSIPMQESLVNVAVDISGRSYLVYNVSFRTEKVGTFDTELIKEFLEAFSTNAMINLHINLPYGTNSHHIAEAIFKGLARALKDAVQIDERLEKIIPSTKGII